MYADTTRSSRKRQSHKVWKSIPGPQHLTFPLPFELRDQILSYLLISTKESLELLPGLWPLYRCDSEYIQSTTGGALLHTNDPALSKQFHTLTQVSRNMRADAINVFFYRNKWNLQILFRRKEYPSRQLEGWNSASMIQKLWGPRAILSMRHVKITLENESKYSQKAMQGYLQRLVKTLTSSRNLTKLEVEWLNRCSLGRDSSKWTRDLQRVQIWAVERQADGTRTSTKHFRNGVSRWEEAQKILTPLEDLRGITEAVVTGCVTDRWALHLEKCMKSDRESLVQM